VRGAPAEPRAAQWGGMLAGTPLVSTQEIRTAAGESLAVLLALLGGSALAASEIQRRDEDVRRDEPPNPPER
jgi:hypothetical protein